MATPKIIPYTVKLRSVVPEKTFSKPPVVYTNDLRSAEFQFKITDMDASELLTATAKTMLYMRDGSFFQNPSTDVSRVGNVFSYLLKENEGNHTGIAKIQLVVYFNEGLANEQNFPTQLYEFEIINGLETKVAQEVMIYDWTTLTRDARAFLDASELAETDRVTAESGRVTAESNRVTAESGRVTAEGNRVTAESGRVTAETNRAAAFTAFGTRLTAEETATANNKISAVKGKTFADVDARLEDVETDTTMMGTNKVTNGDFSGGTTGWSFITAIVDGRASKLATGAWQGITCAVNTVIGNQYYVSAEIEGTSANYIELSTAGIKYAQSTAKSRVSLVTKATLAQHTLLIGDNRSSGWTTYYADNVIAIDLTATFGAGNEPTAEQMDRLLTQFPNSWFTGTENLFLAKWALNELRRLDNNKANKAQEAWITPTLLNGWVVANNNPVGYMKDEMGFVHLKGDIKGGAEVATVIQFPVGYRPKGGAPSYIITRYSTTIARFIVFENGTTWVRIAGGSADVTGYSLDGITFRAEA